MTGTEKSAAFVETANLFVFGVFGGEGSLKPPYQPPRAQLVLGHRCQRAHRPPEDERVVHDIASELIDAVVSHAIIYLVLEGAVHGNLEPLLGPGLRRMHARTFGRKDPRTFARVHVKAGLVGADEPQVDRPHQ